MIKLHATQTYLEELLNGESLVSNFQTVGDNQAFILMGFMGVTGILSMLISNTATTAMMLPIVKAVSDSLGQVM